MFLTQINQKTVVSPDIAECYQKASILSRTEAEQYRQVLKPESPLYQDISRILIHFQSGIHSLSNGQKINATQVKLLGGNQKIEGALIFNSAHQQKRRALYFQAPPGQYIVKWKLIPKGKEEDLQKLNYELYHFAAGAKISEHDLETWERSGKAGLDADVAGLSPVKISAEGSAQKKDEKTLEESYSHQTLVLAVTVNKKFFRSMGSVELSVDVWVDNVPEKKEQHSLKIRALAKGANAKEGGVSAIIDGMTDKETLDRTELMETDVSNATAKTDAVSKITLPKPATPEQMKHSVDIDHLRAEIDRINKELETSKKEKQEALTNYRENKDDEFLREEFQSQAKELSEKIKDYEARKKALEGQVYTILTTGQDKADIRKKK